jgi:hypothetical protein
LQNNSLQCRQVSHKAEEVSRTQELADSLKKDIFPAFSRGDGRKGRNVFQSFSSLFPSFSMLFKGDAGRK